MAHISAVCSFEAWVASTAAPADRSASTAATLPGPCGRHEDRLTSWKGGIGTCACLKQGGDHLGAPILRGQKQWRHTVVIGSIGIRSGAQEF